jgi:PRTRC genetic system protein C
MLEATVLPRLFTITHNGEPMKLPDPNRTWTAEAVLNHYTPLFPILATASIQKPVIKGDAVVIEFSATIGTKG